MESLSGALREIVSPKNLQQAISLSSLCNQSLTLCLQLPQKDMGTLLYHLDLFPPFQGFLDSNQIPLSSMEVEENLVFDESQDKQNQWSQLDIISKKPIFNPSSIKQCARFPFRFFFFAYQKK
jgi:hypothetical protein